MNLARRFAALLSDSPVLGSGKNLWDANAKDWNIQLTKVQKLLTGLYIIAKDYSVGRFPPTFVDQQKAYEAEIDYQYSLPGTKIAEIKEVNMRKPFWYGPCAGNYLTSFMAIAASLQKCGVAPPAKVLELGCGCGWTAEFLSLMRYDVVGTTISQHEVDDALLRVESMRSKHLSPSLQFLATAMEDADVATRHLGPFDAVLVFEALHHAFDWQKACKAAFNALKPGSWFFLCSEPNVLHTLIAYRIARLSNTHEIGFRRSALVRGLRSAGFGRCVVLKNRLGMLFRTHWIAAQKPNLDGK